MAHKGKYQRRRRNSPLVILLIVIILILVLAIVAMLLFARTDKPKETQPATVVTQPTQTEQIPVETTAPPTEDTTVATTLPVETDPPEPLFLPYLEEIRQENNDVVGWIKIEGTKVDYPVMYTPEEPERYLYKNIKQKYSAAGSLFIDANCSISPESDNLIIYGHNMVNGSMFRTLMKYDNVDYWREHPVVEFDFRNNDREYEILAAFYDRVYYVHEECFKFYKFIDADEESFAEAMDYYKTQSLYDTGVTAEYGDHLITLVTCAYHTEDGRFVVVARAKPQTDAE